jgi:Cu/Ag efflux protein CusF
VIPCTCSADCERLHAQEAEAAADAEVTKTEAAIRRIQEAASKHIAAQHEQLRQVRVATVHSFWCHGITLIYSTLLPLQ